MSGFELVNTNITDTLNTQAGIGNPANVYLVPDLYTTIQSAIDTAFANGHDENDPAIVRILPDEEPYEENLTLYSGIFLDSQSEGSNPVINGGAVFAEGTGSYVIRNITFNGTVTCLDDSAGIITSASILIEKTTLIPRANNTSCIDLRGTGGSLTMRDCNISPAFITSSLGSVNLQNGINGTVSNSTIGGSLYSTNNTGTSLLILQNCVITGRMIVQDSSSTLELYNCVVTILNGSSSVTAIVTVVNSATLVVNGLNCTTTTFSDPIDRLFQNLDGPTGSPVTTGILRATNVTLASNSTNFNSYIGIPSGQFSSINTNWSDGHVFVISAAPNDTNAAAAGVPVNALYRSTNGSPDPSPVYIRTA